ncbi:MAG: hypothetical protein Q8859_12410 [Bacteroidota bacterium]|nr:hypothetical protein [Bacteroidota bacterium]
MKKLLFLFAAITLFASCAKDDSESFTMEKQKVYLVNLAPKLEESSSNSSLKVASLLKEATLSSDVYMVQVLSKPQESDTASYQNYACGLFDNLINMNIKLQEGYIYKFQTTLVKDAKNIINHWTDRNNNTLFYSPLSNPTTGTQSLSNSFNYSTTSYCNPVQSQTYLANSNYYNRPPVDRYYGEVSDFVPGDTQLSIAIPMKRVAYGVKFVADGLTDGKLLINMQYAPDIIINSTDNSQVYQAIYTCTDISSAWNFTESETSFYSETVPVTISRIKADNTVVPLGKIQIALQRNKLSSFTIKIHESIGTGQGTITVTETVGDITSGDSYSPDNGTVQEVPVTNP